MKHTISTEVLTALVESLGVQEFNVLMEKNKYKLLQEVLENVYGQGDAEPEIDPRLVNVYAWIKEGHAEGRFTQKIAAIKELRTNFNINLKEAKEIVELWYEKVGHYDNYIPKVVDGPLGTHKFSDYPDCWGHSDNWHKGSCVLIRSLP
jgi:ribosomal protein L7/L12